MEESTFSFRYMRLCDLDISREKWLNFFANNGNPDQRPHSVVSDLGPHYLPMAYLGVSRLKWNTVVQITPNLFFVFMPQPDLSIHLKRKL